MDVEAQVLGTENDPTDQHYKETLLEQLITALQRVVRGGTLVLVVADTFTRFIVGALYVLYRLVSATAAVITTVPPMVVSCLLYFENSEGH